MFDPLLTLNHYRRVLTLAGSHKNRVQSKCLFRFDDPVSPHLAAAMVEVEAAFALSPRM